MVNEFFQGLPADMLSAPDDQLMPPDRLLPLPVLLLPLHNAEAAEQSALLLFAGVATVMMFMSVAIVWQFSERAGIPIFVIATLISGIGVTLYVKRGKDADRSLIIAHDSLWLGDEEIAWARISSLAIEEVEQETGPSEYRVTFCVPGKNTFGEWHSLNPRVYVRHLSPKSRASTLFRCLNEAQRRFLAKEFAVPEAVTPVSPHFQTSIDDIGSIPLGEVKEPYQG
ncbi:hypothetical protein [Dongia rigui]|uniref:Transmembrane protein n=1 Tax=Dongia rigui TaxID=940149 RepID=A0ABU5E2L5_9PROT|nr:hypothetical protein [Dongia rigui]MDY0873854.1 hypothetical protein [Dongia rigui]